MQFGDLEVHLVNDGRVHVDVGGAFGLVPRGLYRPYFDPDEQNAVPILQEQRVVCWLGSFPRPAMHSVGTGG